MKKMAITDFDIEILTVKELDIYLYDFDSPFVQEEAKEVSIIRDLIN